MTACDRMLRAGPLAPRLQMNEGDGGVLGLAVETEAGHFNHVLHFRLAEIQLLDMFEHGRRALLGGADRQGDAVDEIALVLGRQKGRRQAQEEPGDDRQDRHVADKIERRAADDASHPAFIPMRRCGEAAVPPAPKAFFFKMMALFHRRQQAKRTSAGVKRHGQENREAHARHQRERELAVNGADRTAEKRHGNEHRRQHQRNGDQARR